MTHTDNVAALAAKHGLPNPIPHERLWATRIEFRDSVGRTLATIDGTPMNCASRLLLQDLSEEFGGPIPSNGQVRQRLKEYFAERWDYEWSPEHRPMMFWLDSIDTAEILVHKD